MNYELINKAKWISSPDQQSVTCVNQCEKIGYNSKKVTISPESGIPTFKKRFNCNKTLKSADLTVTALGIFDAYINGERVGKKDINGSVILEELKPGWTDYTKRVLSFNYDISSYLACGDNNIVVKVSRGWYSSRISFGYYGYKKLALLASIDIQYTDGSYEHILTDIDWDCVITGPVLFADIWDGEYYDARIIDCAKKTDAVKWNKAELNKDFSGEVSLAEEPHIRVRKNLSLYPVSAVLYDGIKQNGTEFGEININKSAVGSSCESMVVTKGSTLLLDFGQNMVGRPHFKIKATSGVKITVYCAELLNDTGELERKNDGPSGSAYLANYRSALSRIVYIANGDTKGEEYFPLHTFFGFRYLEIEADGDFELCSIIGEVIGSDTTETSTLVTSNEEINRLYSNILWGQRGNYLSIPTDCPQRDERLGWSGDTQIFCGAAAYNADVNGFFKKWLRDARDSQSENGGYCDVIPRVFAGDGSNSNAAWGDAGIIVPYKVYLAFGDKSIITEHYESMEKYMDGLADYGIDGLHNQHGDWLAYDQTGKSYIAIACYAYNAYLMSKMSGFLSVSSGDFYDIRRISYDKLFNELKSIFAERFIVNGELTENSQMAYLIVLRFKLLPDDMIKKVISQLEAKIKDNNYTLSTGFVGTGMLNQTLSEFGKDGLAYSLLLQTANPSWLYSVRQGATTIWERWNSYTLESGFGDVGMNSFNHYAYGAVCEWMFESMAGIAIDESSPGYKHFILSPRPDIRKDDELPNGQERITYVKATYNSRAGLIKSSWEIIDGNKFIYKASIPDGTSATVRFPFIGVSSVIKVNGIIMSDVEICDGIASFELGVGDYTVE
jgi:alpha-L-rhamnosidase